MTYGYDLERLVVALETVESVAREIVNNHDLDDWLVFRLGLISGEVNSLKQIIRKMGGSNDGRSTLDV